MLKGDGATDGGIAAENCNCSGGERALVGVMEDRRGFDSGRNGMGGTERNGTERGMERKGKKKEERRKKHQRRVGDEGCKEEKRGGKGEPNTIGWRDPWRPHYHLWPSRCSNGSWNVLKIAQVVLCIREKTHAASNDRRYAYRL